MSEPDNSPLNLDPVPTLQIALATMLGEGAEISGSFGADILWRPHVKERDHHRGWYVHIELPDGDSWMRRVERAQLADDKIKAAVAAPLDLFANGEFLEQCQKIDAAILLLDLDEDGSWKIGQRYGSIDDLIYERRLRLDQSTARSVLERQLQRALSEADGNRKGVLLEVLLAVLLSQVDGFEVIARDISNRTQQMDVAVENRNVGGTLSNSPMVLGEAKNWKDPVGTDEYAVFLRKLQSRHGRAKLGFLVTTGRFTTGVPLERRRDSTSDILIVLIDGGQLAQIWRGDQSISDAISALTAKAMIGD